MLEKRNYFYRINLFKDLENIYVWLCKIMLRVKVWYGFENKVRTIIYIDMFIIKVIKGL